ncbi:MAG: hypothetical protein M0C28_13210 [Candidatus Moduliflexus flocculans]|nr:hypothetical protein [Candidatus Moduliflexus flocculans]
MIFMLLYYKLSGVNAIVSMVDQPRSSCSAMMSYLDATMTLPGIAGFILTIGMGVDSNVLIFERIKEELAAQKGVQAGDRRRLRPRVPDDSRHARRVAHRGGVPVPVRHGPDPRLRHDAVDRPPVERLHVRVRLADIVRAGPVPAPRGDTLSI